MKAAIYVKTDGGGVEAEKPDNRFRSMIAPEGRATMNSSQEDSGVN